MEQVRILLCGSETFEDRAVISDVLGRMWQRYGTPDDAILVHGSAPGPDLVAAGIWSEWGLPVEAHPARWEERGATAGADSNLEMVKAGADMCLIFETEGESRRAEHCAGSASEAGIPVTRVKINAG